MRKRTPSTCLPPARLLSLTDLASYLGMGEDTASDVGERAGARRKFGRRIVYDRVTIDRYLDDLDTEQS